MGLRFKPVTPTVTPRTRLLEEQNQRAYRQAESAYRESEHPDRLRYLLSRLSRLSDIAVDQAESSASALPELHA